MVRVSDQRLRELERKWRESGSVEDEAAYLRERVRVGDLTQERLELAAHCGHEGARSACAGKLRSLGVLEAVLATRDPVLLGRLACVSARQIAAAASQGGAASAELVGGGLEGVAAAEAWFDTQSQAARTGCERVLVAPLRDLDDTQTHEAVIAALVPLIAGLLPFGHRAGPPPFRATLGGRPERDVGWLFSTACGLSSEASLGTALAQKFAL